MNTRLARAFTTLFFGMTLLAVAASSVSAQVLTLTQDGINLGFTLSTFATIDPRNTGCCSGPFGVAVSGPDRVLVFGNDSDQRRYVFHDTDGQTKSSAISSTPLFPTGTQAYATVNGVAYGSTGPFGQFAQYDSSGNIVRVLSDVPQNAYLGMWGNNVTGHLLATTDIGSIVDIDPTANGGLGSSRTITSDGFFDGITVSPDGRTVYGEFQANDSIVGYNILTGAQVFNSGFLNGGPDGAGVIVSNSSLNGDLVINFNGNGVDSGFVGLLDPHTLQLTIIATGGTRGDYAAPDTTNGTLFLDYSDVVYRLDCGQNCGIGNQTPEPGTLGTFGSGLIGLACVLFRKLKA